MDILLSTFDSKSNYYNMSGRGHEHVSDHLSELIEDTLGELTSKCIMGRDDVESAQSRYDRIVLLRSIHNDRDLCNLRSDRYENSWYDQDLVCRFEFDDLAVSVGVASSPLEMMIRHLPSKVDGEPQARKVNALLQAHFERIKLSLDLREDQRVILKRCVKLLLALVDVISSKGWLKPALACIELVQMVIQGRWSWDNAPLQIPHFDKDIVDRIETYNKKVEDEDDKVENVFDILELEDDVRNDLLRLENRQMSDVARFCNSYPNIEMEYEVVKQEEEISTKSVVRMVVKLSRDEDDVPDDLSELGKVVAPSFPDSNLVEGWWLVVGDSKAILYSLSNDSVLESRSGSEIGISSPERGWRSQVVPVLDV